MKKMKGVTPTRVSAIVTTMREHIRRDLERADTASTLHLHYLTKAWSGCTKKFIQPTSDTTLRDKAFSTFLATNERIRGVEIHPPSVDRFSKRNSTYQNYLVCAKRWCHLILGELSVLDWFHACGHSGGSSVGVPFSDTSVERKFRFPISCSVNASLIFHQALAYNPRLCEAVSSRNCREFSRKSNLFLHMLSVCEHSRATTVPKDDKTDRMIAIEPTANMYLQQGIMRVMYDKLASFGLDVSTLPDRHQYLAKVGSIYGHLSTIDFSCASDSVSIALCQYLLPERWYQVLSAIRSQYMDLDGNIIELSMMSTMGNATTFPLETLVFYCLAMAVENVRSNSLTLPDVTQSRRVSVFGDDCIVPTDSAIDFICLCEHVGFVVNQEKSFFSRGPGFRESCGADFLQGRDVRPLFPKWPGSLRGTGFRAWLVNIYNNLSKKYILYFGDLRYFYMPAIQYLLRLIKEFEIPWLVDPNMPSDSGVYAGDSRLYRHFARPFTNVHGSVTYHYLRFIYFKRYSEDPGIRLQLWLQSNSCRETAPVRFLRKQDPWNPIRRHGSYIVAKTQSCHWPD